MLRKACAALMVLALVGCGDDDGDPEVDAGPVTDGGPGADAGPRTGYEATIVRTTYGIPHVSADNWGDLGFGAGYAYAEDNFCVIMREVIAAQGETLRWFGEEDGDLAGDVIYRYINTDETVQEDFLDAASEDLQELLEGYAAGLSAYLEDTGGAELAEDDPRGDPGCRGADWVRPITALDLGKVYRKLIVRASTGALRSLVLLAEPPMMASAREPVLESTPDFHREALNLPPPEAMGSNAYAIGGDASQTGRGILLGNPHFPWRGSLRWYVQHLTVEGDYDVMGASLQGVPLVNIGFNEDLAWSHTVSTGQRFTFYALELDPADPFSYRFGDEMRRIEAVDVPVEVLEPDGSVTTRTETIYTSHYGPIVELGPINDIFAGWPNSAGEVFTFRDANIDNARALDQFLSMGRSKSIDELEDALRLVGLPWVNTIAADREGNAFYGDVTVVPGVEEGDFAGCVTSPSVRLLNLNGSAALDGSNPDCAWNAGTDAPDDILGFDRLPRLRTRSYVSNSNDSYWLSNPDNLLTGFSPLIGLEEVEQSLRTRLGFVKAEERLAGTDGLGEAGFTVENLQESMYANRDLAWELAGEDVLALCDATEAWDAAECDGEAISESPTEAASACGILRAWDGLYETTSVGAGLWNEVWLRLRRTDGLWATPFDATDPVNTPRDLDEEDADVANAVRCALGASVDFLVDEGIPLDRPWGEVQFRPIEGGDPIPIHGGSGRSTFSVISSRFVEGEGYSDIPTGNSYIQTVTWTDDPDCPDAYNVLTYSQSTNPSSPHYADQTRLYADETWNDVPYCAADVAAEEISRKTVSVSLTD
ncbi:MAG: penicillin acylase family protein [Myxococcota bacterium]